MLIATIVVRSLHPLRSSLKPPHQAPGALDLALPPHDLLGHLHHRARADNQQRGSASYAFPARLLRVCKFWNLQPIPFETSDVCLRHCLTCILPNVGLLPWMFVSHRHVLQTLRAATPLQYLLHGIHSCWQLLRTAGLWHQSYGWSGWVRGLAVDVSPDEILPSLCASPPREDHALISRSTALSWRACSRFSWAWRPSF